MTHETSQIPTKTSFSGKRLKNQADARTGANNPAKTAEY
jgi:hypothetical protein